MSDQFRRILRERRLGCPQTKQFLALLGAKPGQIRAYLSGRECSKRLRRKHVSEDQKRARRVIR